VKASTCSSPILPNTDRFTLIASVSLLWLSFVALIDFGSLADNIFSPNSPIAASASGGGQPKGETLL
jgi:hypothetical protein